MNKRIKGIVLGSSVLVLLVGGLVFLKLTDKPAESSSETEEHVHGKLLWDVANNEDIAKVTVKKPDGESYTATRKKEKTMTTDYETQQQYETEVANYYLDGYEDVPMDTTGIRLLATRSYSVNAIETVQENPSDADLAKYGLDKPTEVTFEVDNADNVHFFIGSRTPQAGYYYLRVDGDSTVYTIESFSAEPFLKSATDFLGTQVTPEQADDDETMVESVRVARKDLPYDIYLIFDPYYEENSNNGMMALHVMQEPIYCLLNVEKSTAITHGLYGLTASKVVQAHPTAADLTGYGFDDPFATVTMKTDDGKTQVFRLGNTFEEGEGADKKTYYYGYLDSVNCVYGFSPDDISYDDVQADSITAKTVVDFYVWDIGKLTYEAGDLKLAFEGTGSDQKDYVLKLNGEETDTERYRLLYTYLLKTAAEDLVIEEVEPTGDPLCSIKIERQDGKRGTEVAFYDAGGMKAYVMIDGQVRYRCRMSYVTTLIENLKIYNDTDKAFTMTW